MEHEEKVEVYWKKSCENHEAAETSYAKKHFNAAASRYYYALYQGFFALFEKRGVSPPTHIRIGTDIVPNRDKGTWPKEELKVRASFELSDFKPKVRDILRKALTFRTKGDYKDTPVEERQLSSIHSDINRLFEVLDKIIHGT